jgi:hypothetical protein
MSLTVRRVVTGHDENGRAIVSIDEIFKKRRADAARCARCRDLDE